MLPTLQEDHRWAPMQMSICHHENLATSFITITPQPCHTRMYAHSCTCMHICTLMHAHRCTPTHISEILPDHSEPTAPTHDCQLDLGSRDCPQLSPFRHLWSHSEHFLSGTIPVITFWPQTLQSRGQTTKTKSVKHSQTNGFIANTS